MVEGTKGDTVSRALELLKEWEEVTPTLRKFDLPRPLLWERSTGGEWVAVPHECVDVYDLIESYPRRADGASVSAFAVVTTGWAVPLGEDGSVPETAPSKSSDRVRVRLALVVEAGGSQGSRVWFATGRDSEEESHGSGALADALDGVGLAVWGREYAVSVLRSYLHGDYKEGNPEDEIRRGLISSRVARFLSEGCYSLDGDAPVSLTDALRYLSGGES